MRALVSERSWLMFFTIAVGSYLKRRERQFSTHYLKVRESVSFCIVCEHRYCINELTRRGRGDWKRRADVERR